MCALALSAMAASCGEPTDDATPQEIDAQEVPGAVSVPSEILSSAPLATTHGPMTADSSALWITDFSALARFDLQKSTWSTIDLPTAEDQLHWLVSVPRGDGSTALVLGECVENCEQDEPTVQLGAYIASAEGLREVPGLDVRTTGWIHGVGSTSRGAHFRLSGDGDARLITVTDDKAEVQGLGVRLLELCVSEKGLIGVAVDTSNKNPSPWRWVVSAAWGEELGPVEEPAELTAMLTRADISMVCFDRTLAVVGADGGWEVAPGGEPEQVASDVGVPNGRTQRQSGPAVSFRGSTWVPATGVTLRRDADGLHAGEPNPEDFRSSRPSYFAVVGDTLLLYPPDQEPAGVPSLGPSPTSGG